MHVASHFRTWLFRDPKSEESVKLLSEIGIDKFLKYFQLEWRLNHFKVVVVDILIEELRLVHRPSHGKEIVETPLKIIFKSPIVIVLFN